jgi:hypothetical protein
MNPVLALASEPSPLAARALSCTATETSLQGSLPLICSVAALFIGVLHCEPSRHDALVQRTGCAGLRDAA